MSVYTNQSAMQPSPDATPHINWPALRRVGGGLALSGLLLVVLYAIELAFGFQHGRHFSTADLAISDLVWSGFVLFTLALLIMGLSLFMLGWQIRRFAPITATLAMLLASVAFVLMPLNLAYLFGAFGPPQHNAGLMHPVLTNLASTVLLSVGLLRSRAVPNLISGALLAAGVVTFPFILLTIPLEAVMPDYVIADLPFAAWGVTLLVVGWLLWRHKAV